MVSDGKEEVGVRKAGVGARGRAAAFSTPRNPRPEDAGCMEPHAISLSLTRHQFNSLAPVKDGRARGDAADGTDAAASEVNGGDSSSGCTFSFSGCPGGLAAGEGEEGQHVLVLDDRTYRRSLPNQFLP